MSDTWRWKWSPLINRDTWSNFNYHSRVHPALHTSSHVLRSHFRQSTVRFSVCVAALCLVVSCEEFLSSRRDRGERRPPRPPSGSEGSAAGRRRLMSASSRRYTPAGSLVKVRKLFKQVTQRAWTSHGLFTSALLVYTEKTRAAIKSAPETWRWNTNGVRAAEFKVIINLSPWFIINFIVTAPTSKSRKLLCRNTKNNREMQIKR